MTAATTIPSAAGTLMWRKCRRELGAGVDDVLGRGVLCQLLTSCHIRGCLCLWALLMRTDLPELVASCNVTTHRGRNFVTLKMDSWPAPVSIQTDSLMATFLPNTNPFAKRGTVSEFVAPPSVALPM